MNAKGFNEIPINLTPVEQRLTGLGGHINKVIYPQQAALNSSIKNLSKALDKITAQYAIDIAPSISKLSNHIATNTSISLSKLDYSSIIDIYSETVKLTAPVAREVVTTYINQTVNYAPKLDSFIEKYLEKLSEPLTFTGDDYIEVPEKSASAISELTDFPEESFEESSKSGFVKIKSILFHEVLIPLLIAIIAACPSLLEQIRSDHQFLEETKSHNARMLKEEREQSHQLEKQTELLQKIVDSDD